MKATPRTGRRAVLALLLVGHAPAPAAQGVPPGEKLEAYVPPPPPAPADAVAPAPDPARAAADLTDGLRPFADDPAHRYGSAPDQRPSWLDLFWRWVVEHLLRPLTSKGAEPFWNYVAPALAVLGLGWALWRLVGGEGAGLFARRDRKKGAGAEGPLLDVEDIAAVDLDARLAAARAAGRARDVVRYRYLRALQALAARGAVAWRKDKTNRDYLAEVRAAVPAVAGAFGEATRVFAWVWYGDLPMDERAARAAEATMDRLDAAVGALPVAVASAGGPAAAAVAYD